MATPPGDDWPKHVRERSIFTIWNPLDNRVYGLAAWRARRQAAINNANNGSGPGGGNNGTGPPGHPRFHGPPDPDYPQRDGSGPNHDNFPPPQPPMNPAPGGAYGFMETDATMEADAPVTAPAAAPAAEPAAHDEPNPVRANDSDERTQASNYSDQEDPDDEPAAAQRDEPSPARTRREVPYIRRDDGPLSAPASLISIIPDESMEPGLIDVFSVSEENLVLGARVAIAEPPFDHWNMPDLEPPFPDVEPATSTRHHQPRAADPAPETGRSGGNSNQYGDTPSKGKDLGKSDDGHSSTGGKTAAKCHAATEERHTKPLPPLPPARVPVAVPEMSDDVFNRQEYDVHEPPRPYEYTMSYPFPPEDLPPSAETNYLEPEPAHNDQSDFRPPSYFGGLPPYALPPTVPYWPLPMYDPAQMSPAPVLGPFTLPYYAEPRPVQLVPHYSRTGAPFYAPAPLPTPPLPRRPAPQPELPPYSELPRENERIVAAGPRLESAAPAPAGVRQQQPPSGLPAAAATPEEKEEDVDRQDSLQDVEEIYHDDHWPSPGESVDQLQAILDAEEAHSSQQIRPVVQVEQEEEELEGVYSYSAPAVICGHHETRLVVEARTVDACGDVTPAVGVEEENKGTTDRHAPRVDEPKMADEKGDD